MQRQGKPMREPLTSTLPRRGGIPRTRVRACVHSPPSCPPWPVAWSTPAHPRGSPPSRPTSRCAVDGVTLRGWEVNPGRERALVYYGGNGEGLDWLVPELGRRFPRHTSYLLAYRGYGASEGVPNERVLTSDALAVHDHAAARHPGPVDVIGRSLGSGVAMQVAVRRQVERLVLITPFDSLVATGADLFPRLPVRHLLRDRWDSAGVAHRLRARVLVVRAGRDAVVWPARTDRLLAVLPATPLCSTCPTPSTGRCTRTRRTGRRSRSSWRPDPSAVPLRLEAWPPSRTTSTPTGSTRRCGIPTTSHTGALAPAPPPPTPLGDGRLRLDIPVDQGLWCPDQHETPLRASGIASGAHSGPVGSTVGGQPFLDGQTVREEQPRLEGWLPSGGEVAVRCRMEISPRSMAAVWLSGFEETPEQSGEICLVEVFGKDLEPGRSAEVGMGFKTFRDPDLAQDFAAPRLPIDVADRHDYAVQLGRRRGGVHPRRRDVRTCRSPPAYPLQLMLAVFDFPEWSRATTTTWCRR